jgi:hypothetical protein
MRMLNLIVSTNRSTRCNAGILKGNCLHGLGATSEEGKGLVEHSIVFPCLHVLSIQV